MLSYLRAAAGWLICQWPWQCHVCDRPYLPLCRCPVPVIEITGDGAADGVLRHVLSGVSVPWERGSHER